MAAICRERKERYNRESKYKAIIAEDNNQYNPCFKTTSPLSEIKEMRKRYPDSAIEQDLIDLGLERLLPLLD